MTDTEHTISEAPPVGILNQLPLPFPFTPGFFNPSTMDILGAIILWAGHVRGVGGELLCALQDIQQCPWPLATWCQ